MWTPATRRHHNRDQLRYGSDLTDAEWTLIAPLFACYATLTVDLREMVNACLYLQKTGCQWRFLPKDFGPWQTVRSWHDRFRADGVWTDAAALLTLRQTELGYFGRDPSQIVRNPGCRREGLSLELSLRLMPKDKFDYLWLINTPPIPDEWTEGWEPVFANGRTSLMRRASARHGVQ